MMPEHQSKRIHQGFGQLTLLEHALCPLDHRLSLQQNLIHESEFQFSTAQGNRQTGQVRVLCPLGLSANDELYLWGLLALTMKVPQQTGELRATPHWCLRQLGLVDPQSRRGGRQYKQFREALRRLSTVGYLNDNFYDPVRCEHRQVSFRFFSYSLPNDEKSNRSWRIVWDSLFLEMVAASAGHLRFDLGLYRQLDPATRRLFLFLSKVFPRRKQLNAVDLSHLAIHLLGFSSTLSVRDQKVKARRCIERLVSVGVLERATFTRTSKYQYRIRFIRGTYFDMKHSIGNAGFEDTPLWETLMAIGFESHAVCRLMRRYSHRLLEEWADITQAAEERFGNEFFRSSPMAFLVDGVKNASAGTRTPPDWWHELKRNEQAKADLGEPSRRLFAQLRDEVFGADTVGVSERGLSSIGGLLGQGHDS